MTQVNCDGCVRCGFDVLANKMIALPVGKGMYVFDEEGFAYSISRHDFAAGDFFVLTIVGGGESALFDVSSYMPEYGCEKELPEYLESQLKQVWETKLIIEGFPYLGTEDE